MLLFNTIGHFKFLFLRLSSIFLSHNMDINKRIEHKIRAVCIDKTLSILR